MSADRPNFLVLLTDQQHANLLGCEGDAYVHTPNLDRLAASGMRFRRTYTTNPVCVPCRYSFVSGGAIPHALPGRSLKPLLLGETPDGWRDHVVAETIHGRMVRTDRWKYELLYVADANVSGEMLIDMERDPGCRQDLAGEQPLVVADLWERLQAWMALDPLQETPC